MSERVVYCRTCWSKMLYRPLFPIGPAWTVLCPKCDAEEVEEAREAGRQDAESRAALRRKLLADGQAT